MKQRIMTWLIILLSLYVIYCGLLFFFQTKLIFPADYAGQTNRGLPTAQTERVLLETDQGETVAWFVPAPSLVNDPESARPLVVFFHGNAELIDHQERTLQLYRTLDISVLMVEYRGYGHSAGTPSEKHIVADTVAVLDEVLKRNDVAADHLVFHGRSIGGGLAAQVARKTEPSAIIVESTFASISGMSWRYGFPPFLVTNPLRTEDAFEQLDLPILIMHGKDDQIVPPQHAQVLAQAGKQTTLLLFEANHNTLPSGSETAKYEDAIEQHLRDAGLLR